MPALATKRILGSTVAELTGGRWAISWIAYVINAPVNLLAVGSNAGSTGPNASWPAWLLVSLIGYFAFGLVFLLAHLTVFRHRTTTPLSVSSVITLGALAGGVRGAVVSWLAVSLGLVQPDAVIYIIRVFTGVVLGAVLVPLVAFMLGSINAYRHQRSSLIRELRRIQAATLQDQGVTRELESALLTSMQADLDEVTRTRDPNVAREVSHRIWDTASPELAEPKMHWGSVLAASVQHNPFATWPVAIIWSLAAIGTLSIAIGINRAVLQIVFSVFAIAVLFAIGRAFVRHAPRASLLIFVTVIVILVVITGPIASAIFDPRPWPTGASLVIANSVWLPLLAIATGFVGAALQSSEVVLRELSDQVSADEINALAARDEAERIRRELATHLHGTVQSRLLAASMLDTSDDNTQWLTQLSALQIEASTHKSLADRLDALIDPWSALLDITMHSEGSNTARNDDAIERIVEEGIANAYRHGGATQVEVEIRFDDRTTTITVRDNGTGAPKLQRAGIGSAIFDALAPDSWSVTNTDTGTTLIAEVTQR